MIARLLTPAETAAALGVSVKTLADWRYQQSKPLKWIKTSRRVMYDPVDVRSYLESCRCS